MCKADMQKREYVMVCVASLRDLGIPCRVTRDYVTVSFPDRIKAKQRKVAKEKKTQEK